MKRIGILLFGIVAIVALLANGTLAYYTASEKATNVITSGNVDLEIHEKTIEGKDFPKDGVEVMPGDIVSKIVTFENTGNHPLYLRVKLTKGVDDAELTAEECLDIDINATDWTYKDGYYYYNTALKSDQITTPLFTEVSINGKHVDNNYLGKMFSLNITAYAVQSEHNGDTVWNADFWPEA